MPRRLTIVIILHTMEDIEWKWLKIRGNIERVQPNQKHVRRYSQANENMWLVEQEWKNVA